MLAERELLKTSVSPRPFREIADGKRHWIVYERADQLDDTSRRCLIFESADVLRLVLHYPANWFDLNPTDLREVAESL